MTRSARTGDERAWHSRLTLASDLNELGIRHGDTVMVHAAVSSIGRLLNGPDALIDALADVTGPSGTVVAYTDWDARYHELLDDHGRLPEHWKEHVPAFDAATSRANRDNGVLPEFLRTRAGAQRSGNPGASVAALGARAGWLTADHPLHYGYGENSPLARLVDLDARVLMVGAPLDTMTILHHAEHLARIPGKRIVHADVPFRSDAGATSWRTIEEYDTEHPIVDDLDDDYFGTVVSDLLTHGNGRSGRVGHSASVLVDAADVVGHAVNWLESRLQRPSQTRDDDKKESK